MHKFVNATMMAVALYAGANGTAQADDIASEARAVDARTVRVVLDGVIDLKLKQGSNAALVISGDRRYLPKVTVTQRGDTLRIGTDLKGIRIGRPNLRAELTLPNLAELVSAGVGSAEVQGFTGDSLRVALDGAGAVQLNGQYRNVDAHLNGAGSMTMDTGNAESVDLNLRGAGQMVFSGQSRNLRARLGGVGSLDAQGLRSDSVDVDMTGLGGATVYAKTSASLRLTGLGSATVYGKPVNRNASARGLGHVTWQ
jgi:Putative auto-transporter adhesin, head GIN domain